jgi:cob(I)alamin adenosyltransferase
MSDEADRLAAEARDLRALADDVEELNDEPRRQLDAVLTNGSFAGTFADQTHTELRTAERQLDLIADNLRAEAEERVRAAERAREQ